MSDNSALGRRYLELLEARDWDAWTALLAADVVYDMPQTRELIKGRASFLEFNQTYPGEWHLTPKVVIADDERAVVWFDWRMGDESGQSQTFLEIDAGRITRVTDFWPEAYDPPERTVSVERY
ncbi:nuclear transport factor 2 family protein [Nocardioides sp. NPDC127514]|jgi:ketosteroid isomerase-like protein|uniref:nuclear transport factor 2 family protein n=1 Tax=unclassified Nocardioides TaxID=2615069 RepID=UPI00135CF2FD